MIPACGTTLLKYMMTSLNGKIFRVTGHWEFTGPRWIPRKGQWHGALMFSLICVWINGWVNNREAGDLRCNRTRILQDVGVNQGGNASPIIFRKYLSDLRNYLDAKTGVILSDKYSLLMHCIKIKSPAKFLLNEQYVFVGGNISFLCVLSCSSEEA